MLVKEIMKVPGELFSLALEEISSINWASQVNTSSSLVPSNIYGLCKSIHLRGVIGAKQAKTCTDLLNLIPCKDNALTIDNFKNCHALGKWVEKTVGGLYSGNWAIRQLPPHAEISLHTDLGEYFDHYSRFHIPMITNNCVSFYGEHDSPVETMNLQTLYKINNRLPHRVSNTDDTPRSHFVLDVYIEVGNIIC